jgi:putative ABC transport system ATP-binding protein
MSILQCENLHKTYGKGNHSSYAVRGITASFEMDTFYSIIGKSGSGKSTFLHLLSGLLKPDEGEIIYDGIPLSSMNEKQIEQIKKQTGIIFQNYQLLPELTVRENILLPSILFDEEENKEWCDEILDKLQITDIQDKYPSELSGGQQQRCAIGRAFINHPKYLFCDEPTGNLDKKTSESVLNFLLEIRELSNPTIVLVTHDLDIARSADVVLHIEDGKLVGDLYEE